MFESYWAHTSFLLFFPRSASAARHVGESWSRFELAGDRWTVTLQFLAKIMVSGQDLLTDLFQTTLA